MEDSLEMGLKARYQQRIDDEARLQASPRLPSVIVKTLKVKE